MPSTSSYESYFIRLQHPGHAQDDELQLPGSTVIIKRPINDQCCWYSTLVNLRKHLLSRRQSTKWKPPMLKGGQLRSDCTPRGILGCNIEPVWLCWWRKQEKEKRKKGQWIKRRAATASAQQTNFLDSLHLSGRHDLHFPHPANYTHPG